MTKDTPWGRAHSIDNLREMASKLPEMSEEEARSEYEDICCEGFVSHEQEERRLAFGQYIQDHFGDL